MPLLQPVLGPHSRGYTHHDCQTHARVVCGSDLKDSGPGGSPLVGSQDTGGGQSHWWRNHEGKEV